MKELLIQRLLDGYFPCEITDIILHLIQNPFLRINYHKYGGEVEFLYENNTCFIFGSNIILQTKWVSFINKIKRNQSTAYIYGVPRIGRQLLTYDTETSIYSHILKDTNGCVTGYYKRKLSDKERFQLCDILTKWVNNCGFIKN